MQKNYKKKGLALTVLLALVLALCLGLTMASAADSSAPFEAYIGSEPVAAEDITLVENGYTPKDPMTLAYIDPIDTYVVAIPEGTTSVSFRFTENRLVYNYTSTGDYLGGMYADWETGSAEANDVAVDYGDASVTADGEFDYLQVQTPYVGMDSTILYAITFRYVGDPIPDPVVPPQPGDESKLLSAVFSYDASEKDVIELVPAFDKDVNEYELTVYDYKIDESNGIYSDLTFMEGSTAKWQYCMTYPGYGEFYSDGPAAESGVPYKHSPATVVYPGMTNGLRHMVTVTPEEGATASYLFRMTMLPTLEDIEIDDDSVEFTFDPEAAEQTIYVAEGTDSLELTPIPFSEDYYVWLNGDDEDDAAEVAVTVEAGETITLTVDDDCGVTNTYTISVKVGNLETVRDNIAAKYAESGVASDVNAPWLAADMMAYEKTFPDTESKLTDEQKQDEVDAAIAAIAAATKPGDVAKNIIALAAMGYDPRDLTTADLEPLDAVAKLDELSFDEDGNVTADAGSPYTLPYVLIAYQQFDDCDVQQEALKDAALADQSGWMDTSWGTDGMTPMMLALAPYYDSNEAVKTALDNAVDALADNITEDGSSAKSFGPAASAGLAMAGLVAMGIDPADVVNETSGKSLIDGLLQYADDTYDGFENNSYSTEQGFRGLIALANERPYRIYDFSDNIAARQPAAATPAKAGVDFSVVPSDATVTLTDEQGEEVEPSATGDKSFNLDAGTYTYTVEKDGYTAQTDTITITDEDIAAAARQTISVTLTPDGSSGTKTVTITVKVLAHDADTCNNSLTYQNDADKYFSILPVDSYKVTLNAGDATAADALLAALNEYDIDYAYNSASGYFSSIGDYAEKEHGDKSGWMYMVDGKMAEVAANEYVFSKNATMIWFYTDDYTNDHGSEQFSGGGSGDEEEEDGDDEEDGDKPVFSDVPADHWANEAVTDLAARGIIKGYGNKVFGADDPVKRCDLVAMLYRLSGDEEAAGASYSDVPADAYYAAAVVWAEKNGIVKGYPDGTFRPENEITREELAAMLYRYAAYKQIELTDGTAKVFKDADAISDYAKDAVDAMTKAGVINGYPDDTFRPAGSATRAETAQMIYALDAMK